MTASPPEDPGLRRGEEDEEGQEEATVQCGTACPSTDCTLTFPLSSQLRIMYRYYILKYSSYLRLTQLAYR